MLQVYYYEIKQDPKRATSIAKDAFDSAISDLDKLDEEDYKVFEVYTAKMTTHLTESTRLCDTVLWTCCALISGCNLDHAADPRQPEPLEC